jgi:deazaflavin-dependent oxidoreductase (nitroreductase family)
MSAARLPLPRSRADRFRWYWKLQGRIDSLQVRWLGTSVLALMLRSSVLLLETTGRRTGRRHRSPVMYWQDGGKLFIGGGAGGMTRVDWVANVRANPAVAAWVKRKRLRVVVHELKGEEYATAREQAFARWPKAAKYERSGRPIPYFRLDEIDG